MHADQSGPGSSALFRSAGAVARRFGAGRAYRDTVRIWERARWMDTPAVYRAAEVAADLLRDAGIADVRIEDVPADGKSAWNGWLMPLAWEVKEARLESGGRSRARKSFADYSLDPQCVATGCPATPDGRFAEGRVVSANDARQVKGLRLKDRFLYVRSGKGSIDLNIQAARRGALGVIIAGGGPEPGARRFLNYAVPMEATQPCVPCFSLSGETAEMLDRCLAEDPGFLLRARVRARRYAGTAPMLTGTVGAGSPEVYLCAHIDEIGALDNASGCGIAVEALRILNGLNRGRNGPAQLRAIRFFFSTEVRGQQAWFNIRQSPLGFLGGINLDMLGSGAPDEPIVGRLGFPHRPHFAGRLMAESVSLANRTVEGLPTRLGANYVSDGIPGIHPCGGNVSIEQKPGPTYHSSADTPEVLNRRAMRWGGVATLTWLHAMTRMDGTDALRVARKISAGIPEGSTSSEVNRAIQEMKSLFQAIPASPAYGVADSPAGLYAAGVRRRSGLWPGIGQAAKLRTMIEGLAARNDRTRKVVTRGSRTRIEKYVPKMRDFGFLNFDALVDPNRRRELKTRTGLDVGWCTETWAWVAATFFDGKHSVSDVVTSLAEIGIEVDPARVRSLAGFLVDSGMALPRPVLRKVDIRKALREAGVKRGSALLVHTSLSRFGYVEGGAATMVAALRYVLGPKGSLLMPTHSNSLLGREPYDPARSPSNTGAVTEYFRQLPDAVRSSHPTHSVAGIGPTAEAILNGYDGDVAKAPMARDGFWGRFYDAGGDVLLMCPIGSATAFHAGETWEGLPQGPLVAHAVEAHTGRRRVHILPSGPWHTDHFEKTMARPLMKRGLMRTATLGESVIHLAPIRAMIDISVEVNRRNPGVSIAKNGGCDCFYCRRLREGLEADPAWARQEARLRQGFDPPSH